MNDKKTDGHGNTGESGEYPPRVAVVDNLIVIGCCRGGDSDHSGITLRMGENVKLFNCHEYGSYSMYPMSIGYAYGKDNAVLRIKEQPYFK